MSKKFKLIIAILLLFSIGFLVNQIFTYSKINNSLIEYRIFSQSEKIQKIIKNYEAVECKYSMFTPKFSIVAFKHYEDSGLKSYDVAFYSLSRPNIFSSDWQIEYTGGTDIKNTTFDELVAMVKKDCYQFQEGHGDYYGEDVAWSYSPYEPEPEMTDEEIRRRKYEDEVDELFYQMDVEDGIAEPRPTTAEEGFRRLGYPEEDIPELVKELEDMPVLNLDDY